MRETHRGYLIAALLVGLLLIGGCSAFTGTPVTPAFDRCVVVCNSMAAPSSQDSCKQKCIDDFLNCEGVIK